jgi:hypothetical protein
MRGDVSVVLKKFGSVIDCERIRDEPSSSARRMGFADNSTHAIIAVKVSDDGPHADEF